MPIIRRPLASEQVGTPGLDFSTARAFESVSSGINAVAARVQKNQQVLDQLQATTVSQDIDIKYTESLTALRQKYNADPNLSLNDYLKEAKELETKTVNESLSNIKNTKIRNAIALHQQGSRGKRYINSYEWVVEQQAAKGLSLWTTQHNVNTIIAEGLENIDQLQEHLNTKVEQNAQFAQQILNPEEAVKKRIDSKKGVVLAYLNGRIANDPGNGLIEFKNNTLFSKILDTDERNTIKTGFLEAITGEKELHKFSVLFDNFAPLDKIIEDGSLKNDAKALTNILEEANRNDLLYPEMKDTLENMISAARTQSKLKPNPDAKLFINLVEEKERLEKTLKEENYHRFLKDSANFSAKVLLHETKGELTNSEAKGLLKPMQEFINNAAEKVASKRGIFGKGVDAFKAVFTGDTFKGYSEKYKKNAYNSGIKKIDNILAPFNQYVGEEKRDLRSQLIRDLYDEVSLYEHNGIEMTNDSLNVIIKRIFNENPKAPTIDAKQDLGFLDLRSGRKYKIGDDGNYYMIG